jgi:antitoxin component HigA of HigAB toxin-antitoxin module
MLSSFRNSRGNSCGHPPIRTNKDHRAALAEIEALWGAPDGTEEGDKLDVLIALVEIYEAKRWPIEIDGSFDPVDVLQYATEELGTRRDLPNSSARGRGHPKFSGGGGR